jgi:hypothetical protein
MEEHSTAVLKGFSVSARELDEEVAAEIVTHYKSISAGPMASGMLLVSRSRTLLDIWRIGPSEKDRDVLLCQLNSYPGTITR